MATINRPGEADLNCTKQQIDEAIDQLCSLDLIDGVADGVGMRGSAHIVSLQLATGGKRLRGLLPVALVTEEGGDVEVAKRFGAAVEAIHNGTLVHDDIQDRDTLRRGQPTLWTQTGVAQAINGGDLLLIAPIAAILADPDLPHELARQLALLLSGALLETIRGQVADIGLRDVSDVSKEHLTAIACAKTSPLFACALQGAAVIVGATQQRVQAARLCGHRLGLAFQLRDDLLDVLAMKGRGDAGSDLREGKPTWPLLAACSDASEDELTTLRTLLREAAAGRAPSADEVARWIQWVHDRGGVDKTRQALDDALSDARTYGCAAFASAQGVITSLCDRLCALDG